MNLLSGKSPLRRWLFALLSAWLVFQPAGQAALAAAALVAPADQPVSMQMIDDGHHTACAGESDGKSCRPPASLCVQFCHHWMADPGQAHFPHAFLALRLDLPGEGKVEGRTPHPLLRPPISPTATI